jgi:DnaJ-class molecular chaperone
LGVEDGAETSVIKRAYRKLSLEKHPDKNPDDPLAVQEFIQITKAYTVIKK